MRLVSRKHSFTIWAFAFVNAFAWIVAQARHLSPVCEGSRSTTVSEEIGGALLQSSLMSSVVGVDEQASALIPGYDPTASEVGGGSSTDDIGATNGNNLGSVGHSGSYYYHSASADRTSLTPGGSNKGADDGYYHGGVLVDSEPRNTGERIVKGEVGSDAQLTFESTSKNPGVGDLHEDVLAESSHASAALSNAGQIDGLPPNILAATNHAKEALSGDLSPDLLAATNHAKEALGADQSDENLPMDPLATMNNVDAAATIPRNDPVDPLTTMTNADGAAPLNPLTHADAAPTVLPRGQVLSDKPQPLPDHTSTDPTVRTLANPKSMMLVNKVAAQTAGFEESSLRQMQKNNVLQQEKHQQPQQQQLQPKPLPQEQLQSQPQQSPRLQQAQQPQQQLQQVPQMLQQQRLPQLQQTPQQTLQPIQNPHQSLQQVQQVPQQSPMKNVAPMNLASSPTNFAAYGVPAASAQPLATQVYVPVPQMNTPQGPPGLSYQYASLPQGSIIYSAAPVGSTMMGTNQVPANGAVVFTEPNIAIAKPKENITSNKTVKTSSLSNESASNSSNTTSEEPSELLTTPPPVNTTGCRTREDARAVVWYMESAAEGTACIFGVDPRDEGFHCIYDNGRYGSNGWCFTDQDRYAWGSCDDNCPLYGVHKTLGKRIDDVTDQVQEVNDQLDQLFTTPPPRTTTTPTTAVPIPNATTASPRNLSLNLTTAAPTTAAPSQETTEAPSQETTEAPSQETTEAPSPETTAETVPPIVDETTPPPDTSTTPLATTTAAAPTPAPVSAPTAKGPMPPAESTPLANAPAPWSPPSPGPSDLVAAPGQAPVVHMQQQVLPQTLSSGAAAVLMPATIWDQIAFAAQRHDSAALRQLYPEMPGS